MGSSNSKIFELPNWRMQVVKIRDAEIKAFNGTGSGTENFTKD
jgi:hypothetical protein